MKEKGIYLAVKLLIDDCPTEKIASLTVSGLARKFNVHVSYLSRSFRNHDYYNYTLHEYLEFRVMMVFRARAVGLKRPNVKEILEFMNIKNTSYFIRRYKKMFGQTPGQTCKHWRDWNKERERKTTKKEQQK